MNLNASALNETMNGWTATAAEWWAQRLPRERLLIAIMAGLAVLAVLMFGVWKPIESARARARTDIRTYETLSSQMRAAGPEAVRRAVNQSAAGAGGLTDSAAAVGLTIRRIDPDGDRTRVALEDVPFAVVVDWLDRVERDNGLRAVEVKMERRPAPGVVNAEITLAAG